MKCLMVGCDKNAGPPVMSFCGEKLAYCSLHKAYGLRVERWFDLCKQEDLWSLNKDGGNNYGRKNRSTGI